MITATLQNYRQSPRKVRVVANVIKGKPVAKAISELDFLGKRAAAPIAQLIQSAVANAKHNFNIDAGTLVVKSITVNVGAILKRSMPRSRGMANRINKRTSHVTVTLAPAEPKKTKKK
jgi:large subunit ribosomal protein L22